MAVNPVVEGIIHQQVLSETTWVKTVKVVKGKSKLVTTPAPAPDYMQKSDAYLVSILQASGYNYTEEEVRKLRDEMFVPHQFVRNAPRKKTIKL